MAESSSTPLSFLDDVVSVETMEAHCEEESDNWVQISVDHPAEIVENTSNTVFIYYYIVYYPFYPSIYGTTQMKDRI